MILLHLQVITGLQIEPEAVRRPEEAREPKCCVSGDAPLAVHDLVDPPRRYTDGHRETVLGHAQRLQELFKKHLPWVNRCNRRHAPPPSGSPRSPRPLGPLESRRSRSATAG